MDRAGVRALVIGGQGVLGGMCAKSLHAAGFEVVRGGRKPETSSDFRLVDLDEPASVESACADSDIVVTAVRHPSHIAERTIAREGGLLVSIASLSAADRKELKAEAAGARGLVALHAGLGPGLFTLVFKAMLEEHPEADGLQIAGTFGMLKTSGLAAIADFAYPYLTRARRHPTRVFEFGRPIGKRRCMLVAGPESGLFGELADGREAHAYICSLERSVQALFLVINRLGLWNQVPESMFTMGSGWRSRRVTAEPRSDILTLTCRGERVAATVIESAGDYKTTAAAGVIFAKALLALRETDPSASGVVGAEELFDLQELRDEIDKIARIAPLQ